MTWYPCKNGNSTELTLLAIDSQGFNSDDNSGEYSYEYTAIKTGKVIVTQVTSRSANTAIPSCGLTLNGEEITPINDNLHTNNSSTTKGFSRTRTYEFDVNKNDVIVTTFSKASTSYKTFFTAIIG